MKDDAVSNLLRRDRFKYSIIAEGVLIGLITGALISVFRLMLIYADQLRDRMTGFARSGWLAALICALIMLAAAAIITALLSWEPDIAGSGIPQVEAELMGQKDMCWWRVIIAKTLGCALAIGGGLALGREGPSIQLGSMVGKGFSRAGHRLLTEERLLITCGAGAGLSAAFGAPLAGAIFSLEELHRNFSAEVLLSTMAASAASDFVAANIFGLTPVFGFEAEHGLPLSQYWAVLLLGIVLGFFGIVYNRTIAFMQDIFDRAGRASARLADRIPGITAFNLTDSKMNVTGEKAARLGRLVTVFAPAFVLMFFYPAALGSGSPLVGQISRGEFTLGALIVLLLIKFIFSTASFGSGSPGGIFLPLLVLGAVTGGLFTRMLGLAGFDQKYITAMVVVAMSGYFAAIVRAPVTGVILITEMTGDFTCLLPLVLTSLIAYLIPEMFGVEPIYTQLLHRSQRGDRNRPTAGATVYGRDWGALQLGRTSHDRANKRIHSAGKKSSLLIKDRKTVIDAEVHTGSFMDGRKVRDFGLPLGTLIVSVLREGVEIIPDGNTILRGGDALELLMLESDILDVETILDERCRKVSEQER
ncbi:MAG: chloride channel protein [Mogibacterium sp.]|nr:chloride channel protein [Mogibacterium sp.]